MRSKRIGGWLLGACLGLALVMPAAAQAAPDRPDPAGMSAAEVTALQRQLTDARCYSGPLDGKASAALTTALAACPDPRPVLRIETGMHVATIGSIGVDAQCRLLATGSIDKTVRLWAMPEGRLLRTQRLPIGAGDNGKVFAVAVSPDGSLVAAGGWDANWESRQRIGVYVFDAATGTQLRQLGAFEDVISDLAFSPDGRRLAIALGGPGVRVLDVSTGRELMADRDYGGKSSYSVAFGPDGVLYAAGHDGFLRRYGPDGQRTAKVATTGGKQPVSVAADPSGQRLAIGFYDTNAVDLYDAASLRRLGTADTKGVDGRLSNISWSRDGARLVAGGTYQRSRRNLLRVWTTDGRRAGPDVSAADDTIKSLTACGDATAFASADNAFGLLRADGTAVTLARGHTADMRGKKRDAFTVSADGRQIRFGLTDSGDGSAVLNDAVVFELAKASLSDAPAAFKGLMPPDITTFYPPVTWENTITPGIRNSGYPIKLGAYEMSRSLAVRPDSMGLVLGLDHGLLAINGGSLMERWRVPVPGTAWGVNLARGGELVIAAYGDGTIRWHRWKDGKELLALFVHKDTRAWVAWTPSGYYTASPGGEDMIGWHVNRGWEQPADFFPASKFRDQYARPDIVERVLDTMDEAEAVRLANAARPGRAAPAVSIAERLPPVVSILSPASGSTVEGESVRLDYLVRSPSNLPVDAIEARIDGRPASAERGLGRADDKQDQVMACLAETQGLGRLDGGLQGCRGSLTLRLPPGGSEVGLFARSGERAGEVARLRLTRAGAAAGEELLKPRLYALVVGVSAYANPDYRLAYAAKDANDFAAALEHQKGGLYAEVSIRRLTDGDASSQAIRKGLDWLTRQVTSRDVGIVYLAGHGVLDTRERFYFLAADSSADELRATAVPREDIQDALDGLAGKALLFLDACHSGAIAGTSTRRGLLDINGVINDFTRSERGVVAFTASTGRQVSQENAAWGNGAFTKAVVEALGTPGVKPAADFRGDGKITTSALDLYVSERVKALTGGAQSPIMIRPPTVPDFPLAVVR